MAQRKDIVVDQGSRYQLVIQVTGLTDLTGFQARGMVRTRATSTGSPLYDMSNKLTVDTINKQVIVDIDAATTAAFTWTQGVYDIHIYNGVAPEYRILEGSISVSPGVTR